MKYLGICAIALLLVLAVEDVFAEPIPFNVGFSEVTTRTDDTTVTGAVTYKLFGGDPGGPYIELLDIAELSGSGTVELANKIGEFYGQACEDGDCGASTGIVTAQCIKSTIGATSFTINLTCN